MTAIQSVPLNLIDPSPLNPRKSVDDQALEELAIEPTPAMKAGRARVEGCRNCGCLVYVSSGANRPTALGPCPVCGRSSWYREHTPVGPFRGDAS